MCGIAGIISSISKDQYSLERNVAIMCNSISHRGPDDFGAWVNESARVALGHRRLSIVDLSENGHQPMRSRCGRYVMVFNGEIYNHLYLRRELEKVDADGMTDGLWCGHSDTETLLEAFVVWGIKRAVERCIGMFAFAVWDNKELILTLGRDRLGEKPLYYGWQGTGGKAFFLFGSELKALKAHPAFSSEINRDALCLLMRLNYIPAPHSIYRGIYKLKPGCLLTLSLDNQEPVIDAYWSLAKVAIEGRNAIFDRPENVVIDELELLVKDSVRQQMMADVPLGAFLSGGVDSSTIVALMQAQSVRPVKTFSIGFGEYGYNEAEYANEVALHLGTDHTELYVSAHQALNVIPKLPSLYCEPFADSSQIPTFLVSQLARQKVAVSLSGDAGDELFCGYTRYQMTSRYWRKLSRIPRSLRRYAAKSVTRLNPDFWDKFSAIFPLSHVGEKFHKGASLLGSSSVADLYLGMISHWSDPANLVLGATEPLFLLATAESGLDYLDDVERMMVLDMLTYLPDDILTKVDRAAMGVGLETRVPFLDHRIVEFAWKLPLDFKLRNGVTKWPLRQVLYRYVPNELIDRPKMGFSIPIDKWLRGPLRDWAESLLSEQRLYAEGYFNPEPIRVKWAEHLSGKRNWQYHLWSVLMFQAWLEEQDV